MFFTSGPGQWMDSLSWMDSRYLSDIITTTTSCIIWSNMAFL